MKSWPSLRITNSTVRDLSRGISSREISPVDVIESILEKINTLNPKLNAFITILEKSAIQDAKNAELEIKQGNYRGPLHGIPISIKDIICAKGVRSTSGSKILSDFVPDYDSAVVKKLKQAGAIIVGMNNTHEFACGLTNINPHFGSSKNPWDINRMSGGSSGGSAVAVSSRMTPAAIGTDTSGSIRVPSSFCGVFGLKPTYGRVSKFGVMKLAPSIDHVGPIARCTWDLAAVLQAISGYDSLDHSTVNSPVLDYVGLLSERDESIEFKLGIPVEFFFDLIDSKVKDLFEKFVERLHCCGISTEHLSIGNTGKIIESWEAIRFGESAAVHSEWMKSRRDEYGKDVIAMLEKGTDVTAVQYIKAHETREKIRNSFLTGMSGYDALLIPTTIILAPLLEQTIIDIDGKNSMEVYKALSRLTVAFDITGLPALNIPVGLDPESKLPVGAQLVGRPFDELTLLKISNSYEQHYNVLEEMNPHTR